MKIWEAEKEVRKALSEIYDEGEASGIADLAIEHLTSHNSKERILYRDEMLSSGQITALEKIIARLKKHEPIQYLMNKAWFYGMELYIDKDVLIPRPETEELVDWIIKDMKLLQPDVFENSQVEADLTSKLKILDVGTGSGCIALALKRAMPRAEVWGCDISDRALNIARRNGAQLDIRVDFQSVDYLDPAQQKHLPSVDVLVSNPPYVPLKDKNEMRPNVLQYEPHTALFVDNDDPLLFYKALLRFADHRLHNDGVIYMEIHEELGGQVRALFEEKGYTVEIRKDMQGKERMVKAVEYRIMKKD